MTLDDLLEEIDQPLQTSLASREALETAETVETVDDFWVAIEEARQKAKETVDALTALIDDHMP